MAEPVSPATGEAGDLIPLVRAILEEQVHVRVEDPDRDLMAEGILDSLGLVDMLVGLERRFSIVIQMDEIEFEDFRTLAGVARWVSRQVSEGRSTRESAAG